MPSRSSTCSACTSTRGRSSGWRGGPRPQVGSGVEEEGGVVVAGWSGGRRACLQPCSVCGPGAVCNVAPLSSSASPPPCPRRIPARLSVAGAPGLAPCAHHLGRHGHCRGHAQPAVGGVPRSPQPAVRLGDGAGARGAGAPGRCSVAPGRPRPCLDRSRLASVVPVCTQPHPTPPVCAPTASCCCRSRTCRCTTRSRCMPSS